MGTSIKMGKEISRRSFMQGAAAAVAAIAVPVPVVHTGIDYGIDDLTAVWMRRMWAYDVEPQVMFGQLLAYGRLNTQQQIAHFLGQAVAESANEVVKVGGKMGSKMGADHKSNLRLSRGRRGRTS